MPRRKRPGDWEVIYAEIPRELKEMLQAKADRERRSLTTELIVALERHTADTPRPARKPSTAPSAGIGPKK